MSSLYQNFIVINIAWKNMNSIIIVQVIFCDNWKAMNSDRIEAKEQVKGPRIDFVCVQLKLLRNPARLSTLI